MEKYITINDRPVLWEGETNILALTRKANIDIPTFCYHSDLSIYGACRLCMVEVEGRGLVTSCSTEPFEGMKIKTHTDQILKLRKTIVEMLLANHDQECTKCSRTNDCKLRDLSNRLSIDKVRFRKTRDPKPMDLGSECLVRDPNKCVLCGDCVRFCDEIQGIGAIDFVSRGQNVTVAAAYGKSLAQVDCVNCGQCAAVCPTGAIVVKNHVPKVWEAIHDKSKTVVAQIAPAVRVALGEMFNLPAGDSTTGKMIAAMRMIGFDKVFDTAFSADLTVVEEANEFVSRKAKGERLPIFTSCCPAWVKYAEQFYPKLLNNLSSCRSPQQMFGAIAKERLPEQLKVEKKDLVVVSIMPCTAKIFECKRPEFSTNGIPDVDVV
ncbi:MAG: [Fe-Fe] hydrogenase large subunit C-terminal domain-containing protein, partial [Candidatus Cloacimonetes bacterium]|nr:[Fe-Fe] hydrogenase large subunit C-terminal domain-containing protein [Candidatus Cloacimonadota bacterium]